MRERRMVHAKCTQVSFAVVVVVIVVLSVVLHINKRAVVLANVGQGEDTVKMIDVAHGQAQRFDLG